MRIWVTGIGMVSALGASSKATTDALFAGEHGVGKLSLFDLPDARADVAAEVRGMRIADVVPRAFAGSFSRTDTFAFLAAGEAMAQAKLDARLRAPVDLVVGGGHLVMVDNPELHAVPGHASCSPSIMSQNISWKERSPNFLILLNSLLLPRSEGSLSQFCRPPYF